jgi:hypothetical protein
MALRENRMHNMKLSDFYCSLHTNKSHLIKEDKMGGASSTQESYEKRIRTDIKETSKDLYGNLGKDGW